MQGVASAASSKPRGCLKYTCDDSVLCLSSHGHEGEAALYCPMLSLRRPKVLCSFGAFSQPLTMIGLTGTLGEAD